MNPINWMPGKKTYLAGSALILIGLGQIITELLSFNFTDTTTSMQVLATMVAGPAFQKVMEGLTVIFLRKGISG